MDLYPLVHELSMLRELFKHNFGMNMMEIITGMFNFVHLQVKSEYNELCAASYRIE